MNTAKTKKGFTLIELLVVISIIGILSSVVMTATNKARSKARDAQLLTSKEAMQKALTLYYDNTGYYPAHTPDSNSLYYTSIKGNNTENVLKSSLTPSYMNILPTVGMFNNSNKQNQLMSRLSYRRITNPTSFGLTPQECPPEQCYALLVYTEEKTSIGPANTAIYFLSDGRKLVGYLTTRY